ncbi:MAG: TOBE domain-containing protein [Methanophagales archaeon]|nr:TOBE domain-containing protein [Methanophagales archaeon]
MRRPRRKYESKYKPWLEFKGKAILGEGRAKLLRQIHELSSIRSAAEKLSIPYRSAWEHIRKIERAIGTPVIKTYRGGAEGGGGAELTEKGEQVLNEYERYKQYLEVLSSEEEFGNASLSLYMKIGAQNRLKGVVKGLEKDEVTASVRIEVETPAVITALITTNALEELNLKAGDSVETVIKATEVKVSKT